jgi:hypothetical protein
MTMRAFSPPAYCGPEVTGLAEFSGFNLARISALPKKPRAPVLALRLTPLPPL